MGKIPHGCATTTPATRRFIQQSTESVQKIAKHLGINVKTVTKWRERTSTEEAVRGPKPASTVLTPAEEAAIVLFRQQTRLPLDDCLYALQEAIPHLRRSSLHRCLERHGISRLPELEGTGVEKAKFKAYPIGYLHVDFAEVRTEAGKQYRPNACDAFLWPLTAPANWPLPTSTPTPRKLPPWLFWNGCCPNSPTKYIKY